MKGKISILLFFFSILCICHAQDTVPARYQSIFGDSSTSWFVYYSKAIHDGEEEGTISLLALANESIDFGGTFYKLLWYVPDSPYDNDIQEFYPSEALYLRESPDNSRLYFKEYYGYGAFRNIPEILIMDLDLNVGDTLDTRGWNELVMLCRGKHSVIRIDTIYYNEGRKVLRTNFIKSVWGRYPHRDTLRFIEGVGPSFGPFYAGIGEGLSLTCYYRDGEPIYHGTMYKPDRASPCHAPYYNNGINSDTEASATISPNPTHNNIDITLSAPANYKITITSSNGVVVYREEFSGVRASINLQGYPRGVYFATIASSGGKRQTAKVIKL